MGTMEGQGQWDEGAGSRMVNQCVNGGAVEQREGGAMWGEWYSEIRVGWWREGEAVGHVMILLFHSPT